MWYSGINLHNYAYILLESKITKHDVIFNSDVYVILYSISQGIRYGLSRIANNYGTYLHYPVSILLVRAQKLRTNLGINM